MRSFAGEVEIESSTRDLFFAGATLEVGASAPEVDLGFAESDGPTVREKNTSSSDRNSCPRRPPGSIMFSILVLRQIRRKRSPLGLTNEKITSYSASASYGDLPASVCDACVLKSSLFFFFSESPYLVFRSAIADPNTKRDGFQPASNRRGWLCVFLSGWWDLNPRPPGPEPGALPS